MKFFPKAPLHHLYHKKQQKTDFVLKNYTAKGNVNIIVDIHGKTKLKKVVYLAEGVSHIKACEFSKKLTKQKIANSNLNC